jgi:hypothetical protein
MGGRNTKINTNVPIDQIIKRIDECILPDEKEVVLDFLEILEAKLDIRKNLLANCKALRDIKGIPILIGALKILIKGNSGLRTDELLS